MPEQLHTAQAEIERLEHPLQALRLRKKGELCTIFRLLGQTSTTQKLDSVRLGLGEEYTSMYSPSFLLMSVDRI